MAQATAPILDSTIADNPAAPAFVRYWTKADKAGFWPAMVCPLLTHNGHGRALHGAVAKSILTPTGTLILSDRMLRPEPWG